MSRRTKLSFALAPALLLVTSAVLGASPGPESRRVALDAAEIRTDFPQLFAGGTRVDMEPRATARELAGSSGLSVADYAAYDLRDGRIVFTPARQYMPTVDGLRPEGVSLRRHGVRFKYSFR